MPMAFKATALLIVLNLFKREFLSVIRKPSGTFIPILFKTFLDLYSSNTRDFSFGQRSHIIDGVPFTFQSIPTFCNAFNAARLFSKPVSGIIACFNKSFANFSGIFSSSDVISPTGHFAFFLASLSAAIAGYHASEEQRLCLGRSIIINKKSYVSSIIVLNAIVSFTWSFQTYV